MNKHAARRPRHGIFVAPGLTNKAMNDDVYAKRRKVIDLIHEAKRLFPNLPRITVRIAENAERILGCARRGENVIWITEGYVASKHVVFHEILHAVFSAPHVAGCPLMAPIKRGNPTDAELNRIFREYAFAVR